METTNTVLQKVAAFLIKGPSSQQEILVFQHPTAGIQVHAGTVEVGESPEDAVLREVYEEASLANLHVTAKVTVLNQDLNGDRGVLLQPSTLAAKPGCTIRASPFVVQRGWPVRLLEVQNDFASIRYEEYDFFLRYRSSD